MKSKDVSFRKLASINRKLAKSRWGNLVTETHLSMLDEISRQFKFSVARADVILLDGCWYVTHAGLLRLARSKRCAGIQVRPIADFSDASCQRWVFEATVFRSRACRGFVGYGDADPLNVPSPLRGAVARIAETRAESRALRKAYAVGLCSLEEVGSSDRAMEELPTESKKAPQPSNRRENGNGCATVRDRLCLIIRQYQLDPNLVKAYAADFCSVKTLREATREQVESFVAHLADWAQTDRNALLCQLNSHLPPKEGAA